MSEIRAILYDLDGVLVDACDWHYDALNRALLEVCGFKIGRKEHERTFNGLPTRTKLGILEEQNRVCRADFDRINELKQRHTMEILNSLTVDEAKVDLHKRVLDLGLKTACVTNAIRPSAISMLENTGQLPFIDLIVSNQDVCHPKPCGEGYVVAMVFLGVFPREALIVEDAPKGIQAAESTGAHVLKVANAAEVTWERISARLRE